MGEVGGDVFWGRDIERKGGGGGVVNGYFDGNISLGRGMGR